MPQIQLTVLIARYARQHYLGTHELLTATVRSFADYLPGMLPLVHPSPLNFRWLAKHPWYEAEVLPQPRQSVHTAVACR